MSDSTTKHRLINGNCLDVLPKLGRFTCLFADPPDNIGLGYGEYRDNVPHQEYVGWLGQCVDQFIQSADIVWISFNAKWADAMGGIIWQAKQRYSLEAKHCVQVYTFGQHNKHDLGNNRRPLWRLRWSGAPLYPDSIRVPSWRQLNGDKRANPDGRVPGDVFDMQYPGPGDVFDFPRVTGNSRQRCHWHPTQLHEDLVQRCVKLSTSEGDTVADAFGGTGTTLRVCEQLGRSCTLIEFDSSYCERLSVKHSLKTEKNVSRIVG